MLTRHAETKDVPMSATRPTVGDIAPDFTVLDHRGEQVTLSTLAQQSPVALVFFPLAFTGTCTGELCELRDNLAVFDDAGVALCAVSVDNKASLAAFAAQESYEFRLLSDFWPHGAVAKAYGVFVAERGFADRATFVIDEDRIVRAAFATSPGEARDIAAYRLALEALTTD